MKLLSVPFFIVLSSVFIWKWCFFNSCAWSVVSLLFIQESCHFVKSILLLDLEGGSVFLWSTSLLTSRIIHPSPGPRCHGKAATYFDLQHSNDLAKSRSQIDRSKFSGDSLCYSINRLYCGKIAWAIQATYSQCQKRI